MYGVIVEKTKQFNTKYKEDMKYKGISANESFLLSRVKDEGLLVFGVREIISLTGWNRNRTYNTLTSLERKGIITRIRRNVYAVTDDLAENAFGIATETIKPSYISFWTALSHYGFTEQQVMTIQLVSTRQVAPFDAGPLRFEVVKFKASRFFGYEKTERFVIAEREKAIIDSLSRLDLCGGISEFAKCLRNAWPFLERMKFAEYLVRFGNKSLISRAGHLTDRMGLTFPEAELLLKFRSPGFIRLDPGAEKTGSYDKRWHIMINADIEREEIR